MKEYTDEELVDAVARFRSITPEANLETLIRIVGIARMSGCPNHALEASASGVFGYLKGRESILREQAKAQAEAN